MITPQRIQLEPAWLLHRYPYRESSLIVEALTRDHGRVGLVARGARRMRRGGLAIVPFTPMLVSFRRGAELCTLSGIETAGAQRSFTGKRFLAGCYVNELLLRLLPRDDPVPEVYRLYCDTLAAMRPDPSIAVRRFEGRLIQALGFLPALDRDASGLAIDPRGQYRYDPDRGPVSAPQGYRGEILYAIAEERYEDKATLRAAACIFRAIIESHLGGKPLRTLAVARAVSRSEETTE